MTPIEDEYLFVYEKGGKSHYADTSNDKTTHIQQVTILTLF